MLKFKINTPTSCQRSNNSSQRPNNLQEYKIVLSDIMKYLFRLHVLSLIHKIESQEHKMEQHCSFS